MRAIVYLILILSTTAVLSGCIKKSGYYDAGQKKRIEQLTNKKWERDYRSTYYGYDVHEIWCFGDNGKGAWRTITTYTDGGIRDTTTYFSWAFTTPQFNVIYEEKNGNNKKRKHSEIGIAFSSFFVDAWYQTSIHKRKSSVA